jgi:peptide deformylase
LDIKIFPHPAIRHVSKPVMRINRKLAAIVDEMFELMYKARGVGLAANQVGLPLRLFVMNSSGKQGEGIERVFINPVISRQKGMAIAEEGCLSLPELEAEVRRPEQIHVRAFDLKGNEIAETVTDYESRIIQHETDHLDGVLFTDRVSPGVAMEISPALADFCDAFDRSHGENLEQFLAETTAYMKSVEKEFC